MKRIAGSILLLAGLGGCVSPSGNQVKPDAKAETKTTMSVPPANGFVAQPATVPTNPTWTAHPAHQLAQGGTVDPMTGHLPPSGGMMPSRPVPVNAPALTTGVSSAARSSGIVQTGAVMPQSLVPEVRTPPRANPPAATGLVQASGSAPAQFPSGIPVSAMPQEDPVVRTSATQQPDPVTNPGRPEPAGVAQEKAPSATVSAKNAIEPKQPDSRAIKVGSPLVRLVNTKRITLNFEVKDVGPSGLSNVELWYTQNCSVWKKYDAPTTSKAYVVEVDEEGMYGFTLVAKSGLGLGKEPPAAGDQPQVWVIVDMTPPEVQLSEVTPSLDSKQQQVTLGWKTTDKNIGRTPVTLSYAESESGPWKVIATNLESTGKFTWQVPQGAPARMMFRVEAADVAGNVARAQSSRPVLLDNLTPTVSITAVESNSSH